MKKVKNKKCSGIYKITNIINGHFYIGSSINISKRWNEHKRLLKQNKHDNNYLQNAWNKYGENSFVFNKLEIVADFTLLTIREQHYLDLFKPLYKKSMYNICLTAGNMLGFKHSDNTKSVMSKQRIGNKYSLGYRHTDEAKNNMSIGHSGLKHKHKTIVKMIKKKKYKPKNEPRYSKTKSYTNDIKLEIIKKYNTGEFSTRMLSKIYGISKSTIWNIIIK